MKNLLLIGLGVIIVAFSAQAQPQSKSRKAINLSPLTNRAAISGLPRCGTATVRHYVFASSKTARARARTLKQLEQSLGDDHNLVVLERAIEADPQRFGDARTIAVVLGCLEKSRLGLRKRSLKLGARLFVRPPRQFLPAVEGWLSP